jgi:NAD(P)-dependent dehydrogenase (short-subunit alcohol dehydrogenase family)
VRTLSQRQSRNRRGLAHYLLTRLLLPDLQAEGHIVFVSSGTHDPNEKSGLPEPRYVSAKAVAADFEAGATAGRRRYTTSKLGNVYCTYEYARRLAGASDPRLRSIRVNAFDPGLMPGTGLARTYPAPLRLIWNYVLPVLTLFWRNVHRPSTSGKRLAALATGGMGPSTGKYYSDGRDVRSSTLSYDTTRARDLWDTSADMTGLPRDLGA